MIAETEHVQLERLGFYQVLVRNVVDLDFGKVRLSGFGTQAREFRAVEGDHVVVSRMLVREFFEDFGTVGGLVLGLVVAEQRDAFEFSF